MTHFFYNINKKSQSYSLDTELDVPFPNSNQADFTYFFDFSMTSMTGLQNGSWEEQQQATDWIIVSNFCFSKPVNKHAEQYPKVWEHFEKSS